MLTDWRYTLVTGSTGDITLSSNPAYLCVVRVGGTAATVGAAVVKDGSTTVETLAATSAVGTSREFWGVKFSGGLKINLANSGDTILVIWQPAAS